MTVPLPAAPEPAVAPPLAAAYDVYHGTGAYDRRYPVPNRTVLAAITARLPPGGNLIDYGCGSGRYLLALAGRAGVAAGFDISPAALARLRRAVAEAGRTDRVAVLGPDPAEVAEHVARHGPADVALCLFGVLSHIVDGAERRRMLVGLAGLLRPGSGRLILSVPNRRRRFRNLQRALPASRRDEVRYVRRFAEGAIELSYKLFDPETLRAELADAGLEVERMAAESVLPESVIGNSRLLRAFDRIAAPVVPAALGYGLLAVARPGEG